MVLHAIIASRNGANKIIVNNPDTDVLVLLVHHRPIFCVSNIFFLQGEPEHILTSNVLSLSKITE